MVSIYSKADEWKELMNLINKNSPKMYRYQVILCLKKKNLSNNHSLKGKIGTEKRNLTTIIAEMPGGMGSNPSTT